MAKNVVDVGKCQVDLFCSGTGVARRREGPSRWIPAALTRDLDCRRCGGENNGLGVVVLIAEFCTSAGRAAVGERRHIPGRGLSVEAGS